MRTITKRIIHESRSDLFRIAFLGCSHLGNSACAEKVLEGAVQTIADDPMMRWVGMGDYCDWINRKDPRFRMESLPKWLWGKGDIAKAERERALEVFSPIAGQCLGLIMGNHEDKIYAHSEVDVYSTLCEQMGASEKNPLALGFSGFLRLVFERRGDEWKVAPRGAKAWTLDLFLTHGWWGGRLYGNGELNLERVYGWVQADAALAGHDHKVRTAKIEKVRPAKNGGVEEVDGWIGSCGTFLGLADYSEMKGYRPLPRGWLELWIEPDKHRVRLVGG